MTRRSQRSTHRSRQSAAASSTVHADSTPLVDSPVQHSSVQHSSVTATTTLTHRVSSSAISGRISYALYACGEQRCLCCFFPLSFSLCSA